MECIEYAARSGTGCAVCRSALVRTNFPDGELPRDMEYRVRLALLTDPDARLILEDGSKESLREAYFQYRAVHAGAYGTRPLRAGGARLHQDPAQDSPKRNTENRRR